MLIVGTVFMPLWPLFGAALARQDAIWLSKTARRMSLGGAAVVLVIGLGMTVFADPLMHAWMHRSFANQQAVILGWTAAATVIALTAPYNMVLNASGMARKQIFPWMVFVILSISIKYFALTAETVWLSPWITALVYIATVLPVMMITAKKTIKSIQSAENFCCAGKASNPI
jgi:O-antigen/teichoic acid export membrane protein